MQIIQCRVTSFRSLSILIKDFWVMASYQFVHSFRRYEHPASICKVVQKVKLSVRIEKLVIKVQFNRYEN